MAIMDVQNVNDYCKKCKKMKLLQEKRKKGEDYLENLANMRTRCARCRVFGKIGIYKADAILTALELSENGYKNRNVGKKPVREKQYGTAVKNLRAEGKTIRQIAKTLGISVDTVQKILKNTDLDSKP